MTTDETHPYENDGSGFCVGCGDPEDAMVHPEKAPEGMQRVDCPLCGKNLGWQEADQPIDWNVWCHSRCPGRLAQQWGLTRDQVEKLTVEVQSGITWAFPDIPLDEQVRDMRMRIAAECVLELLSSKSYAVSPCPHISSSGGADGGVWRCDECGEIVNDPEKGNVYGRVLPIDQQGESSVCVTCGHPHWDAIRLLYVRCGMCPCENVGRNSIPVGEGSE